MAPSDSHGRILFDQVLNSNNRTRAQTQGGGTTSGNSKDKRFLCMFCNKGFSCTQKVEGPHRGEPFSCTQCHMRFAQAGDLKRHQRVHSGARPFACMHCRRWFSERGCLRTHHQKNHSTV
uniref:C2H2-type domain-containing protein n=1 Tax=Salmo trutta TaxID=8032 RepID=A0A674AP49_SALTR